MNINEFVPFKISENIDNSIPFVALSDTYPNDKFELWTKENWEEMKEKNSKSVDSFKSLW
jgi:DNA-binding transcriptional regulator/RsmH inhibitor MraZ